MGLDKITWLGCDTTSTPGMLDDPKCAEFMRRAVVATTRPISSLGTKSYENFINAYYSAYKEEPSIYCDTTYDALKLAALAIDKAGIYDGKAIKDALLEVGQNYHGVSGDISFSKNGDRLSSSFEIWKVQREGEKYKYVKAKNH
jgi:branched-chain amino acid transport system substrate-binding protein